MPPTPALSRPMRRSEIRHHMLSLVATRGGIRRRGSCSRSAGTESRAAVLDDPARALRRVGPEPLEAGLALELLLRERSRDLRLLRESRGRLLGRDVRRGREHLEGEGLVERRVLRFADGARRATPEEAHELVRGRDGLLSNAAPGASPLRAAVHSSVASPPSGAGVAGHVFTPWPPTLGSTRRKGERTSSFVVSYGTLGES